MIDISEQEALNFPFGKFHTKLKATQIKVHPRPIWRLDDDLVYWSVSLERMIIVPEGFETDFASVPRLPLAYYLAGGKADSAAVIHDYLYETRMFDRKSADQVFYDAIRALGHSEFTAWIMWAGVRIGGGIPYRTDSE